ncbi:2-succinyl-5-enolpyruvyl-6-hydroxy-3-cyclohexene-1-carboxylic-acid synthase [Amnibacterium kyonggiense]|uniref:2-succinyl-5-enolpyruvyl-6-hydroxy-3-cyclohexene-1-carboxylate synthase n=1 Tax=Amnibacterium kyonggiense TaxID=595671 RepID=A0A4R7FPL4_9MICO|nr:2-succinyl-5-enolpyruvyl-6-hydroxy-3-cyclohexene-1-carboxylic-acid synthase [Amnibacterium kyonggiense]TDS79643.1 2-succinyl-5-enolpyruvyl-6-hydroxy-3-cyclohexene-1-carboxylate synthase [Amnibacterium kyonggiense]
MTEPSPAGAAAARLLARLVGLGLQHVVVSPGSRSQALALAAAALERSGALRVHVRIDERVGGFTALGLAAESGRPVAVVVTSGTAVAELHPAVLEAHHAGVPLLLLTADRPAELRGTGSNQTTVQPGIFGVAVAEVLDVPAPASDEDVAAAAEVAERAWSIAVERQQPVQVDLAYREPLSTALAAVEPAGEPIRVTAPTPEPLVVEPGPRTVVIAGDRAGEAAEAFARELDVPLLAEVSSGARFGPQLVGAYRPLLDDPDFGGRIERAVVFGHPTLSRQVPALLVRPGVEVLLVGPSGGERYDPTRGRAVRADSVRAAAPEPDRSWRGSWVAASRRLLEATDDLPYAGDPDAPGAKELREHQRTELAALRAPITRRVLVDAVWRATWPHDRLVVAASRLIREMDAAVPGKRIRVLANRGLAGIDGTVATATGVALAAASAERPGTTRVLLGDLALLHDAGALLRSPGEPEVRLQVIVGDDGGGTIFDSLEVAGTADAADFERVLRTPREVDYAALAAAYGWEHRRITTRGDLDRVLTAPAAGRSLIEVPLR